MVKCIALDLDHTTLNSAGKLSEANREALEAAHEAGVHVVVASGRAFSALPKDIFDVKGIEYAITENGAAIYKLQKRQCIRQLKLPRETVLRILELTYRERVEAIDRFTYEAFVDGVAYAGQEYVSNPASYGATEFGVKYVKKTRNPVDNIVAYIQEHSDDIDCLNLLIHDEALHEIIRERITQRLPEVYVTSSAPTFLEVAHRDTGKEKALKWVLEQIKVSPEETAAFGDEDNDAEMIRFVGHGVAMENASFSCLEAARYVTKHHDEDGVAFALKYILNVIK